ncbi:hypothetical protein, partial [Aphanothece stagnina]
MADDVTIVTPSAEESVASSSGVELAAAGLERQNEAAGNITDARVYDPSGGFDNPGGNTRFGDAQDNTQVETRGPNDIGNLRVQSPAPKPPGPDVAEGGGGGSADLPGTPLSPIQQSRVGQTPVPQSDPLLQQLEDFPTGTTEEQPQPPQPQPVVNNTVVNNTVVNNPVENTTVVNNNVENTTVVNTTNITPTTPEVNQLPSVDVLPDPSTPTTTNDALQGPGGIGIVLGEGEVAEIGIDPAALAGDPDYALFARTSGVINIGDPDGLDDIQSFTFSWGVPDASGAVNTRTFQFSSLADLISSGSALVSFTLEAGDGDATPEG